MRMLLLLMFLLIFALPGHSQNGADNGSQVAVLGSKWFKSRQVIKKPDIDTAPAAAMNSSNKIFERTRRANDPAGVRDPNADTIDGRSAALEKSVREARSPKETPVDGFAYRAKVQNNSTKVIEVVFWEYQFKETLNPTVVARRQFLCGVNIKPSKDKELQAFSASGPSDVISAVSLANKSGNLFLEKIVINRVEYSDGSIWQRKDWDFAEVKSSIARAIATPWGAEMCRSI